MPLTPAQQRLAERYMPFARALSRPYREAYPALYEDLIGAADLALVESASLYDGESGAGFAAYARLGIIGALTDLVRDWLTREKSNVDPSVFASIADTPPVGDDVDQDDATEHLIRGFPVQHRALVRLVFVERLSIRGAADRLGLPRSTAHDQIRSALAAWEGARCA